MFKTILVAIDGSDQAELALQTACDLAQKYDADIHLVHSPEMDTVALAVGSGAFNIEPDAGQIAEAGKTVMDKAVKQVRKYGCSSVKPFINNGNPAKVILKQAEASSADLIVTGRRGLGGLSKLVLGNVSQKVSENAKCACMSVA